MTSADTSTAPEPARTATGWISALVVELVLDLGLGLAAYFLALAAGWGTVGALLTAGAVAVARTAWTTLRRSSLDTSLLLVVLSFLVTLGLSFLSGDGRVLLLKGSAGLALFGLVAAGSLVAGRPLLFWLTRRFVAPGEAGRREWEELWHGSSPFRWLYRRLTVVWAAAYLLAAVAHVSVALSMPVETAATVLRVATPTLSIVMIGWTAWYSRRAENSLERPLLDAEVEPETA